MWIIQTSIIKTYSSFACHYMALFASVVAEPQHIYPAYSKIFPKTT